MSLLGHAPSPYAPRPLNSREAPLPPIQEDTVVLNLTKDDRWTIRDCFEGTQIFGATGSGKSSGSGRTLAIQYLKSGMEGLVLTVKPDECAEWRRYAEIAGRDPEDIVVLSSGGDHSFGFFEYEREVAESENLPVTETIVNLMSVLFEVSQRKGGGGQDAYWQLAVKQLVRNAVDLLLFAGLKLTFENLYSLITSAPTSPPEATEIRQSLGDESASSFGFFRECLIELSKRQSLHESPTALKLTLAYWLCEYANLAPETRSSIVSFFTTIADLFARGVLNKLFAPAGDPKYSFSPDLSRQGKILIIDLPVKRFLRNRCSTTELCQQFTE